MNMDRFSQHRNAHLNADPTDDELRYEIEDEGPIESAEEVYRRNYEHKDQKAS